MGKSSTGASLLLEDQVLVPDPLCVRHLVAPLHVPGAFGEIVILNRRAMEFTRGADCHRTARSRDARQQLLRWSTGRGTHPPADRRSRDRGARRERTRRASRFPRQRTARARDAQGDPASICSPTTGWSPRLNTRPQAIETPFSMMSRSSPTRAGTSHCSPSSRMPTMNAASAGNTSDVTSPRACQTR